MRSSLLVTLLAVVAAVTATPVEQQPPETLVVEARAVDVAPIQPSPADPLMKRDGAHHGGGGGHHGGGGGGHHGGGGHGGSFGATGSSSYAVAPNSFVGGGHGGGGHGGGHGGHSKGHSKGFVSSGHGGGFGASGHGKGGGGGHGKGGGFGASGHGGISNHIGGGGGGYGAPVQQSYEAPVKQSYGAPAAPAKQTGFYYYYYPVQVDEGGDKKSEKGFFDKMKKLFEPMMYPWTAMMDYFGYGGDYDDYDYDTYGLYARSFVNTASEYIPWDRVDEMSNVVMQDQCVEFFACQIGSYGRSYRSMHFLLDYVLPDETISDNSYYRSLKSSILDKTDCAAYSCPLFRRREIKN